MSSRIAAAVILMASLAAGCRFVGEDNKQADPPLTIKALDLSCLKQVPANISAYFTGDLQDDSQIRGMFDCASQGLEAFRTLTQGQTPGAFQASELQGFLNRFLTGPNQIPDSLRDAAFGLKAGLIGGSATAITNAEIQSVQGLLAFAREQFVAIKQLMPFSQARATALTDDQILALLATTENAGQVLGNFFDGQGPSYSFASATAFLQALEGYYGGIQGSQSTFVTGLTWLRQEIPALAAFKQMLIGGWADGFGHGEWTAFMRTGAQAGNLYFYVQHFLGQKNANGKDWFSEWGTQAIQKVFDYATTVLISVRGQLPSAVIPADAVNGVLTTLTTLKNDTTLTPGVQADSATIANAMAYGVFAKTALLGGAPLAIDLGTVEALRALGDSSRTHALWAYRSFVKLDPLAASDGQIQDIVNQAPYELGEIASLVSGFKSSVGAVDDLGALSALASQLTPGFTDPTTGTNLSQFARFAGDVKQAIAGGASSGFVRPQEWAAAINNLAPLVNSYFMARRVNLPGPSGEDPRVAPLRRELALGEELAGVLPTVFAGQLGGSGLPEGLLQALLADLPDTVAQNLFPNGNVAQGRSALANAMVQFFALKTSLLGGNPSVIGAPDLAVAARVIAVLQASLERMKGYFTVDFSNLGLIPPNTFDALVADANRGLGDVVTALGSMTSLPPLSQTDAAALLTNLQTAFGGSALQQGIELVPLVFAYKNLLLGTGTAAIAGSDWAGFLRQGGAFGGATLRFVQFISNLGEWDRGAKLARLLDIESGLMSGLKTMVRARPPIGGALSVIPFGDFDTIIDAGYAYLAQNGTNPSLTSTALEAFLRPVVQRLMASYRMGLGGRQATGITLDHLDYVDTAFQRWSLGIQQVQMAYNKLGGGPGGLESQGYLRADVQNALAWASTYPQFASPLAQDAGGTLLQLVGTYRPLFLQQQRVMSITYDQSQYYYSYDDMSRFFFYDCLILAFLEAYTDNDIARAKAHTGLLVGELQNFISDSHDMIIQLHLGRPDQTPAQLAAERFREADIFMSHSNGGQYFTRWEGTEYLGFLATASVLADMVETDMAQYCPSLGPDAAGKPTLDMTCFRARFSDEGMFNEIFALNAPWLARQYDSWSAAERQTFIANLEIGARNAITNDPIDSFRIQNFVLLPFYIESIFKRFDVDLTGILSLREALAAFPVVCSTLEAASPFTADCTTNADFRKSDVGTLFGYLLVKGQTPPSAGTSFWDTILNGLAWIGWSAEWSIIWSFHMDDPTYNVDRARLMAIVAALAESSSSSSSKLVPAPSPTPTPTPTARPAHHSIIDPASFSMSAND